MYEKSLTMSLLNGAERRISKARLDALTFEEPPDLPALSDGLSQLLSAVRRLENARLENASPPRLNPQTVYEQADAIVGAIARGEYKEAHSLAVKQRNEALDARADRTKMSDDHG